MTTTEASVVRILRAHLPEILASSVRRRALTACGVAEGALAPTDMRRFIAELRPGLRLFADPQVAAAVLEQMTQLLPAGRETRSETLPVRTEQDISRVRMRARELAQELGGGSFVMQRAVTIASELSRNIVSYAGEGHVELEPRYAEPPVLRIVAFDRGPGIKNLEEILSGEYRSKTGLGKGIAGVKKLATKFDVKTGPKGTRVEAEIVFG